MNEDDEALNRETFTFAASDVAPSLKQIAISCRVYRRLGATVTEVVNDGITLRIREPLPPGAFVRWRYDVKNPQVRFNDASQTWSYTGEAVKARWSNLHRTDRPCSNASKRSRYEYETQILDALPFPIANIAAHRAQLCDYCFYGGPGGLRPAL